MEREVKTSVWIEDALLVSAKLNDFGGSVSEWKNAIYEIFRYNMTWSFAYQIDVRESRNHGVYVSMHCNPSYEKDILGMMEDLNFREVKVEHVDSAVVQTWNFPDDLTVMFVRED